MPMQLSAQHPVGTNTIDTTFSTRPMGKVTGSHIFKIMGYSLEKDADIGKCISSTIFRVGEHDWNIEYYPNGYKKEEKGYASIFLILKSKVTECVKTQISFTVVDQSGSGLPELTMKTKIINFKTATINSRGFYKFATQVDLESRIKDDCLVMENSITVFKEFPVEQTALIVVPPVNMPHQLGLLLETGTGADITFDVNGKKFRAHKCILAARSPVFSAQFFGPMMKKSDTAIKIEEMEAPVFKALLHFIYNDSFLETEEIKENKENQDNQLLAQHLLVAADRYNVERLRIICEKMLCDNVEKSNVITLLTLAERHSCNHLRAVCVKLLGSPGIFEAVAATEQFQILVGKCLLVSKELLKKPQINILLILLLAGFFFSFVLLFCMYLAKLLEIA